MILPHHTHECLTDTGVGVTSIQQPTHDLTMDAYHCHLEFVVQDLGIKFPSLCFIKDMSILGEPRSDLYHGIIKKGRCVSIPPRGPVVA